jgi:hypothetical protein
MKIIKQYYDDNGKLRILKEGAGKNIKFVRFKVLHNKKFPCCDFYGECTNKAYAEVYPFLGKNRKNKGWNYLCKKHYIQEQRKFKGKLPACLSIKW